MSEDEYIYSDVDDMDQDEEGERTVVRRFFLRGS